MFAIVLKSSRVIHAFASAEVEKLPDYMELAKVPDDLTTVENQVSVLNRGGKSTRVATTEEKELAADEIDPNRMKVKALHKAADAVCADWKCTASAKALAAAIKDLVPVSPSSFIG